MGLLKRIYVFYKNVMDIYNIDFVTRKTYIKFPLTIFMLVCFIFTGAVIYNIDTIDYFSFVYDISYILICCTFFLYLPFLYITLKRFINGGIPLIFIFVVPFFILFMFSLVQINTFGKTLFNLQFLNAKVIFVFFVIYNMFLMLLAVTVKTSNKKNKIYESIINNKTLNKYILRPLNHILTLNIKEKLTRAEYIIALIFIPAATMFTTFISYKIIQGLRYIYRFNLDMQFYDGGFYGATTLIYFAAVLLCAFIIIISSCILLILRLNDLINNNIIKIVICIDMAIFITFLYTILDIPYNYISIGLFLSFLIILFIMPAFFKSKASEFNKKPLPY